MRKIRTMSLDGVLHTVRSKLRLEQLQREEAEGQMDHFTEKRTLEHHLLELLHFVQSNYGIFFFEDGILPRYFNNILLFRAAIRSLDAADYSRFVEELLKLVLSAENVNKDKYIRASVSAFKAELLSIFSDMDFDNRCSERQTEFYPSSEYYLKRAIKGREEFGRLLVSADTFLLYEPGPPEETVSYDLFSRAVDGNLLPEAVLLYDTGFVSYRELAALAETEKVQRMLADDPDAPMTMFLRSVLKQPRSLRSAAVLEVSRLLGCAPGKVQRAASVGLPEKVVDSVLLTTPLAEFLKALPKVEKSSPHKEQSS